jgi:hypothetical protein
MTNDLQRALDSVADSPTPDFIAGLAGNIEREMSGTTAEATVSHHLGLLAAQPESGQPTSARTRAWRTTAVVLVSAAVITVAVALASPFGHDTAIRTGTTVASNPTVAPTSSPKTPLAPVDPTTPNESSALTVASTPAEWEALPPAPLPRREHPLVVAMGKEVLVVGGINRQARVMDGAVFDGNSWRRIPSAPSVLTDSVPAVWTGSAIIALGDDGNVVSFTPGVDQWKVLSKDATTPRSEATAAWSGSEFLVAGGTDPRIAATSSQGTPRLEAVAFNPTTRSWRTLPMPPGTDPLLGPSAWTGTEWLRAAAPPLDGRPAPTSVGALDPTTNRWRTLPDLPGQASAVVRVGSSVAAFSQDPFGAERFLLGGDAWVYDGTVPTFEQTTFINNVFVVAGSELATGYLTITYRQAGGGWGWVPNPISLAGDERYVQTTGGDLVAYAGGKAARLRPISDPTVGLPPCKGHDFQGDTNQGPDAETLVLINTGPACTFNQDDERNLQFRVQDDWTNPVEDRRLTRGGLGYVVEPQGRLTVNFANVDLGVYRSPCVSTPPTTGPIYAARFTLSSAGDPIELKVTVPAGCVGLAFSVAPPRPPEPPTTTAIVPAIPSDRWETLPDVPGKPMYKPLVVVLGTDVLVVGGHESLQADQVPTTAGALFDGTSWRVVPDAPVPLAAEASAVWTGSNLLVVSTEGTILTFTLGPDRWEVVGKAPQPNRFGAQVVWTGDEMLFSSGGVTGLNSEGGMNVIEDAVAYRPSTKTWRAIPHPPTKDPLTGKNVWTGKEWVRTVGWREGKFEDFGSVAAYDPTSNRWRELPQLAAEVPPTAILMEGGELVAYTRSERWRFDGETWLSAGALPPVPASNSGLGEAWFASGQAIKTKTDPSGYFEALEGLDAKGVWQPLGEPFPGIRIDATMRTAGDRFILISYGKAARLRVP